MEPGEIWLQWHGDSDDPEEDGEVDVTSVTWSMTREFSRDVCYVRKDVVDGLRERVGELERLVLFFTEPQDLTPENLQQNGFVPASE